MFLDIAIGALLGIGVSIVSNTHLSLSLISGGVFFALLPDTDFIIHRFWRQLPPRFDYLHRDILHKPLLYIPLGAGVVWWVSGGSDEWTLLFVSASLWHFVHDSTGVGFGVKWLWPFSSLLYGFRHQGLARCIGLQKPPWFCGVDQKQVDAYVHSQGSKGDSWIRETYGKFTSTAVGEYGIIALIILGVLFWLLVSS